MLGGFGTAAKRLANLVRLRTEPDEIIAKGRVSIASLGIMACSGLSACTYSRGRSACTQP